MLDYYGELLTEKQKDFLYCYYDEDLSLSEIADNYGVSRQCVYETIKNAQSYLFDFEKKLKMVENFKRVDALTEIVLERCIKIEELNQELIDSKEIAQEVLEIKNSIYKFTRGK